MPVSVAYLTVVLIWSTTPLGIVWSSESISPTLSLLMRMLIAITLGLSIMKVFRIKLDWRPAALRVYCYSSLSLFLGMLFCYLAARYISSGLMALCFGFAPILSGLLAQKILAETKFSNLKKVALFISICGLAIVCSDNLQMNDGGLIGITFVAGAVFLFSLSGVLVKSVPIELHPLSTTLGALIVSLPFYFLSWWLMDGNVAYQEWQPRAIWAVIYLGVFASLVAFLAYFFILQKLDASTVALVTMMTPVLSMSLGIVLNDEPFNTSLLIGGALVVSGLGIFQFGHKLFQRKKLAPKFN